MSRSIPTRRQRKRLNESGINGGKMKKALIVVGIIIGIVVIIGGYCISQYNKAISLNEAVKGAVGSG